MNMNKLQTALAKNGIADWETFSNAWLERGKLMLSFTNWSAAKEAVKLLKLEDAKLSQSSEYVGQKALVFDDNKTPLEKFKIVLPVVTSVAVAIPLSK